MMTIKFNCYTQSIVGILSYTLFFLLMNSLSVNGQKNEWAITFGGTGNDVINAITTDNVGNVYSTGYFSGTVDFDPGPNIYNLTANGTSDIFVCKLDPAGGLLWAHQFGGADASGVIYDTGNDIKVDVSGNIMVCGNFKFEADFDPGPNVTMIGGPINGISSRDIFLLKLTPSGTFSWAHRIGGIGNNDTGESLAISSTGFVYMTGMFTDSVQFNPYFGNYHLYQSSSFQSMYTCRFNSGGTLSWAVVSGVTSSGSSSTGQIFNPSLAVDVNGSVVTIGNFSGTIDLDPSAGTNFVTSSSSLNTFVSKISSTGSFVWGIALTGVGETTLGSIITDSNRNIYITGGFKGTIDFDPGAAIQSLNSFQVSQHDAYVVKLTEAGNFNWVKQIGKSQNTSNVSITLGKSIRVDATGNIYMGGIFGGTVDFDPGTGVYDLTYSNAYDGYVMKLNSSGSFEWAARFGGSGYEEVTSLTLDPTGNILLAGYFSSNNADFYPPMQRIRSSAGLWDGFITKYNPCLVTTSTSNVQSCNSYLSPSGNTLWTTSGTFHDLIQSSSGCDSIIKVNLTIHPPAGFAITYSGSTAICPGAYKLLSVQNVSGLSYQWTLNGNNINGATNASYNANSAGVYTCTITSSFCAATTSNSVTITYVQTAAVTFSGLANNYLITSSAATLIGSPAGGTFSGPGVSGNIFTPSVAGYGTHVIIYSYIDGSGCTVTSSQSTSVCAVPGAPTNISGTTTPCAGSSNVSYSCATVVGATTYNWTVPTTASIVSGQGTNAIIVNFSSTFTSGVISVTAASCAGTSSLVSLNISGTPLQPAPIVGQKTAVCAGTTGLVYSIPPVIGATSYLWTAPSGSSIASGQGTNQITVNFAGSFKSGNITVAAVNACGAGPTRSATIRSKPPAPGVISGPTTFCAYQQGVIYSINAVNGASNYHWLVPTGATIVSGQGTTSIVVNYGNKAGKVRVRAENACGYSSYRQINVSKTCRIEGSFMEVISETTLIAYPNPTSGEFQLSTGLNDEEKGVLNIYDGNGKLVYSEELKGGKHKVNGIALKAGIYQIILSTANKQVRTRIVKTE